MQLKNSTIEELTDLCNFAILLNLQRLVEILSARLRSILHKSNVSSFLDKIWPIEESKKIVQYVFLLLSNNVNNNISDELKDIFVHWVDKFDLHMDDTKKREYLDLFSKVSPSTLHIDMAKLLEGKIVPFDFLINEVPCHTVILAARSLMFAAMMNSQMRETQESKTTSPMKDSTLKLFLEYLYTANVNNIKDAKDAEEIVEQLDLYFLDQAQRHALLYNSCISLLSLEQKIKAPKIPLLNHLLPRTSNPTNQSNNNEKSNNNNSEKTAKCTVQ